MRGCRAFITKNYKIYVIFLIPFWTNHLKSKWHYDEFMVILCIKWLHEKPTILWFDETRLSCHSHLTTPQLVCHNYLIIRLPSLRRCMRSLDFSGHATATKFAHSYASHIQEKKQWKPWNQHHCRQALPLTPQHQSAYSLYYSLYISYATDKENLFNNQEPLKLGIISFILMTLMSDLRVILWGGIRCKSLMRVKSMML